MVVKFKKSAGKTVTYLRNNGFGKPKVCPLEGLDSDLIDYKNIELLSRFTSEYGRILPRRITGVSPKKQNLLARAVKRARYLALLPYCSSKF